MHGIRSRWATLLLVALLALTPSASLFAQSEIYIPLVVEGDDTDAGIAVGGARIKGPVSNSYIVILGADPVAGYRGSVAGLAATAPNAGQKIDVTSAEVQSYVQYLVASQDAVMTAAGVDATQKLHSYAYALNGFAAQLTPEQVDAVAQQPGVLMVLRDEFRVKQDDDVPAFLGLTGAGGAWSRNYTGEGVIVGIIDTGIWPEHPSFADDGSYAPVDVPPDLPCTFGNTAWNSADAAFTCNQKLLGARQVLETYKDVVGLEPHEFDSARDDEGHGTHTASTAAGNANVYASIFGIPRGRVSGVAPRARIIAYKALGEQGGFTSDLAAAIDQAVADGVDVINYSIGGGATLVSADEIAFLFAADAGVFVATSAGNSGPEAGSVGGPANVPWVTAVGASFPDRAFISEISVRGPGREPRFLWGGSVTHGVSNFNLVDAEGIADSEGDTSGQCLHPFEPGTFHATDAVLCNRYDFGVARTDRVQNVKDAGGGAVIFHNVPSVNVTPTDNHPLPTVHMLYGVGLSLKRYLNAVDGPVEISFTDGRARYAGQDRRVTPNVMTSFSSRGPNIVALDIIKPDVTAPGYQILAGASPVHGGTAAQGELFQAIMGTSMSSPHVAGLFALIKQAHSDWTPAMARSALMTTASQRVYDSNFYRYADPFDMGAGHVDATLRPEKGSMFMPGLVYDVGYYEYLGFLCSAAPEVFTNPAATCATLMAAGISTDPSDLNLPSIGVAELTGEQTITRTFMSVAPDNNLRTYHVDVDAPRGFRIKVEPDTVRLRNGETATYQVTITNHRAPAGEWRFGSLTWSDRGRGHGYDVYSPIALRATLLDAPSIITSDQAEGSDTFPIKFGYTGEYAAVAHGLIAPTITSGAVAQDSDQEFDPEDGESDVHTFALSGVVHFRIAMPPEATTPDTDIDLYVYDPNGELVGASFNPGTDELVDIPLPVDGTWTVYVHGWQADTPTSPYDLYTWEVPATSGGTLTVTDAPASATSGQNATVSVAWTGAVDNWYLGAVTHESGSETIGLTLVDVDTRP